MIRDLLLSIALYGGVAICLERWATFNWWLYGLWINQLERYDETETQRLSTKKEN